VHEFNIVIMYIIGFGCCVKIKKRFVV